jgi:hypothetical protein
MGPVVGRSGSLGIQERHRSREKTLLSATNGRGTTLA